MTIEISRQNTTPDGSPIDELLYSVQVVNPDRPTVRATVRYCDLCRRWGIAGSTHVCGRNWRPRLSDLLLELTRDGRR